MLYIPGLSYEIAATFSRMAWRISRPESLAVSARDVTQMAFSLYRHPQREEWALLIDDATLYRNPVVAEQLARDPQDAVAVYQGVADAEETAVIVAMIIAQPRLEPVALIPQVLRDGAMTATEMQDEGWFGAAEIL